MIRVFSLSSTYSLKKSKHILRHAVHLFNRKKKTLSQDARHHLSSTLQVLQQALIDKDREKADLLAKEVLSLSGLHLKKTSFDHVRELIVAILFALSIAVLVRQMWFEFYEIPTGSMRPTLREQDRLVVSKTNFGINIPLSVDHLYFDPNLVKRNGIFVFTGENMDIRDVNTMYFYIFPGKKQYIKRLIGKPGDVLYFYGGEIYGIDKEGNDISSELQLAQLNKIEHIPFIDFDRKTILPATPTQNVFSPAIIYQMNEPVAKLFLNKNGMVSGEVINNSTIHLSNAPTVQDYFDLWGFKNFGMTRLLTRDQVKQFTDQDLATLDDGQLYLEITHHPSVIHPKLYRDEYGRLRPGLSKSTSIIPLQAEHLKTIADHMYTARFCVKNGIAYRYGMDTSSGLNNSYAVKLPDVPDGCYEFYHGKAHSVGWQGVTSELPSSHPLYQFTPARLQLLYNVGIEWDMRFMPQWKDQRLVPSRYTYFRHGDLYLLGSSTLNQADPILAQFNQREQARQQAATQTPYFPFQDAGAPVLSDGSLNIDFIKQYGLLIPPKSYLALGDNHAMSSDSRDFGFVPQSNLRGAPDFIFWPPGSRWGTPNQPAYPWFNLPRTLIWIAAGCSILGGTILWRRKNKLPLKIEP